jgi:hypothetical protein
MKRGMVMTFDEFFGDIIGYVDSLVDLIDEGNGCYKLEVMLMPFDYDTGFIKDIGSFVIDIVELEYKNIEVFEGVYLDICKELGNYECLNVESILDKRSGLSYENGLYFKLTKLG